MSRLLLGTLIYAEKQTTYKKQMDQMVAYSVFLLPDNAMVMHFPPDL